MYRNTHRYVYRMIIVCVIVLQSKIVKDKRRLSGTGRQESLDNQLQSLQIALTPKRSNKSVISEGERSCTFKHHPYRIAMLIA